MLAGVADYCLQEDGHAANETAVGHMLAMGSAWLLFTAALALRGWPPQASLPAVVLGIELAGFVAMVLGGWLGGSLVYRHGVGVETAAADPSIARE